MALHGRHAIAVALALVSFACAAPSASAVVAPIQTIAGNGQASAFPAAAGTTGNYVATSVPVASAAGVSAYIDRIHFASPADNRILEITSSGFLRVLAGTGLAGNSNGPSGEPYNGLLRGPLAVGSFMVGNVIADTGNFCVRTITGGGIGNPSMATDAGTCNANQPPTQGGGGTPPTNGTFAGPQDVEVWPGADEFSGIEYYVPDGQFIRAVSDDDGSRSLDTVAGNIDDPPAPPADNTIALDAYIGSPNDVAVTASAATYYFTTTDDATTPPMNRVIKVTGGKVFTAAGLGTGTLGDGAAATAATLSDPTGVMALSDGGFLVYDGGHARIRRVSGGGTPTIETLAGNGVPGSSPDGTPADAASLRTFGRMVLTEKGLVFTQMGGGGSGGLVRRIPASAIVSGPSGAVAQKTAAFGLASWDKNATYECRVDLGAFGPCATAVGLSEGPHTFQARATTNNGTLLDVSGTTRTWTVDTVPPAELALVSPAVGETVSPRPTFTWNAATDATTSVVRYELLIDGTEVAETTACCSLEAPATIGDGVHSWQVRAVDAAGNARASEQRSFGVSVPPTAALTIAPERALVNRTVTFDATRSSDGNGSVTRHQWDLDGDGSFETDTGASATTTRSYDRPQTLEISLRVTDNDGLAGTTSATLTVSSPPPAGKQLGVSINDGAQFTNDPDVTIHSVWPGFAADMLFSNDGGFKLAQRFSVAEKTAWKLDSSGPERLPKTVYVRFLGGLQTSETYTDDIILDETPPKLTSATLAGPAPAARAAAARKVTLKLKASDNVSGVGGVQVTANKRRPGKVLRFKKSLKVVSAAKLHVRVRDRAGNFSAWRTAKRR